MLSAGCWARVLGSSLRSARFLASETEARAACLDSRGVLRLGGAGVLQFLQGLLTNDVSPLAAPGAPPVYACILNAQGRCLHDMLLFRASEGGAELEVYLDADREGKEDLLRLLKRYRLRQKFDIEDVSDRYSVWVQFGGSGAPAEPAGGWHQDPRLPQLGLRAILPRDAAPPAGGSSVAGGSWHDYRRWRLQQGVAEGDSEIPSGEVIPLEYNVDGLHGISFTKGCYVGQELMARTHFKGVVRKRVMPFRLRQPAPGLAPGSDVFDRDASGKYKPVGRVRVVEGELGLALLRLAKVMPALDAGRPLYVAAGGGEAGGYAEVEVWRPEWWPAGWGREEQQQQGGGEE